MSRFSFAGDWNVACPCPWKPLVDTWASDPFLPQDPREALISGKFGRVPLLTGICSEEGVLIVSDLIKEPKRWQLLVENWKQYETPLRRTSYDRWHAGRYRRRRDLWDNWRRWQ